MTSSISEEYLTITAFETLSISLANTLIKCKLHLGTICDNQGPHLDNSNCSKLSLCHRTHYHQAEDRLQRFIYFVTPYFSIYYLYLIGLSKNVCTVLFQVNYLTVCFWSSVMNNFFSIFNTLNRIEKWRALLF